MRRIALAVLLGSLVLLAGCNGLFGDGGQQPVGNPGSPSQEGAGPDQTPTPYPEGYATDALVLQLSDLPEHYSFAGEELRVRSNLSDEERQQFEQRGVLREHRRIFQLAPDADRATNASIVVSTATVFEDRSAAEAGIESVLADASAENTSTMTVAGQTATQATYERESGLKMTVVVGQRGNLVYYVVTGGEVQYHEEMAERLFTERSVGGDA